MTKEITGSFYLLHMKQITGGKAKVNRRLEMARTRQRRAENCQRQIKRQRTGYFVLILFYYFRNTGTAAIVPTVAMLACTVRHQLLYAGHIPVIIMLLARIPRRVIYATVGQVRGAFVSVCNCWACFVIIIIIIILHQSTPNLTKIQGIL